MDSICDRGIIRLVWCDTRDMIADGMTKGVVDRKQLRLAMANADKGGIWQIRHPVDVYPMPSKCEPTYIILQFTSYAFQILFLCVSSFPHAIELP